jgi:hypothetical protein
MKDMDHTYSKGMEYKGEKDQGKGMYMKEAKAQQKAVNATYAPDRSNPEMVKIDKQGHAAGKKNSF